MLQIINDSATIISKIGNTSRNHALYKRKDTGLTSLAEGGTKFIKKDELSDLWMGKINKLTVIKDIDNMIAMPKYDGCACAIRIIQNYNKEIVIDKAVTRGRDIGFGHQSTNITEKVNSIIEMEMYKKLVHSLKTDMLCIRGEIVLKDKKLTTGPPAPFVAGKINGGKEVWEKSKDLLQFIPFEIIKYTTVNNKNEPITKTPTQKESLDLFHIYIKNPVPFLFSEYSFTMDSIQLMYRDWCSSLPEPLDGVVYCSQLWQYPKCRIETSPSLYGKFAWKPTTEVTTILTNITYDIAKDGKLTMSAEYEPVKIFGKNYIRAKMTVGQLNELEGIGIGSEITIKMQGDIIPYISDFEKEENIEPYQLIKNCPFCSEKLTKTVARAITLKCTNQSCIGMRRTKMLNFFKTIKYKGIAEKRLERIPEEKFTLKNIIEEYNMKDNLLEALRTVSVRDFYIAMDKGTKVRIEKDLGKTELGNKLLRPVLGYLDLIEFENENDREIVETLRNIMRNEK
jgi:NAD-dependent DNA ligase